MKLIMRGRYHIFRGGGSASLSHLSPSPEERFLEALTTSRYISTILPEKSLFLEGLSWGTQRLRSSGVVVYFVWGKREIGAPKKKKGEH